jgi:hypothetical protein
MAGAKKILRPSPPHTHKPPEVPFRHVGRPDNKKATTMRGFAVLRRL